MQNITKDQTNIEMFDWWQKIDECCRKLVWIREISNSLKHKSGVSYINLDIGSLMEIRKGTQKMSEMYLPKEVNIDTDYIKIIEAHNEIVKVYSFIVDSVNKEIEMQKSIFESKNSNIKLI